MEKVLHEIMDGIRDIQPWDGMDPPRTRFPDLDIYDHDFHHPLRHAMDSSYTFSIRCTSNILHINGVQFYEKMILRHLDRYARFVMALTGQDTVSLRCDIKMLSLSWQNIIIATRPVDRDKKCRLQSLECEAASVPVSDFSYSFNPTDNCNDELVIRSFTDKQMCDAKIEILLLRDGIPDGAIPCLVSQIECYFNSPNFSSALMLDEEMSILPRSSVRIQPGVVVSLNTGILHKMFELQAKQNPERCAIEFLQPELPDVSRSKRIVISYEELDNESERIAGVLREIFKAEAPQGLRNQLVPVFISTSPELYTAYLAILKAGLAFCPLPVDGPSQRLLAIVDIIKPAVVLGVGPVPENGLWPEMSQAFRMTWLDVRCCVKKSPRMPNPQLTGDSLAYVMFTSGSSGKPKGVQVTHQAATSSIFAHMGQYENTMSQKLPMRWYQFAAPTFDPSIMEIFVTLSNGGTLCAAPRSMTLSAPEVAITETRSTITMATPGLAAMLDIQRLPTLNCLWTMGETLSRSVIAHFREWETRSTNLEPQRELFRPNFCLCNAYGPTEAAINVTFFPNVPQHLRGSIIGYPLGESRILVIDPDVPDIRPVPLGFVGELAITGPQLALGYLNEPSRDSPPAFMNDKRYGRLYRTGDRARVVWDSHGVPLLEYLGRLTDDQIKINGQRVELGEIESVLCDVPMIQSAITVAQSPSQNSKQGHITVACLVLEPGLQSSIEEICREAVALRLPSYMIPTRFFQFDKLPRTSVGKIDRKKIAHVVCNLLKDQNLPKDEQKISPDTTANTTSVLEEEFFGLVQSLNDALFETTGALQVATGHLRYELDSLSAMRFMRNINKKGIENISLDDILHARSVKTLAQLITSRSTELQTAVSLTNEHSSALLKSRLCNFRNRWQSAVQMHFKLEADDICEILPTTETQSRILLSFSKSSADAVKSRNYIHHSLHNFRQEVDILKLRSVWRSIVRKHDIYRTVFMPVDDEMSPFAQVVLNHCHDMAQARWLEEPLDIISEGETMAVISSSRAEKLIALGSPTPVLTVLKDGKETSIMLSMIHAIFDLGSLQLLIADIVTALKGKEPGHREELRTAVEAHYLPQIAEMDTYWEAHLTHQESSPFPSLTPVRPDATLNLSLRCQITSKLTLAELEKRSRRLFCSPLSVLQAAWSAILYAYTSSAPTEVIFGSLVADRAEGNRSLCIAPMFTVVPTRIRPTKSSLNIDILRSLTEDNFEAASHLHSSARSKGYNTRSYDTTIALQVFQDVEDLKDIWGDTDILPMAHDFAVMIEAAPDRVGRVCYKALYNDSFLDQSSAQVMLSQLDEILIWMLANPMLPYLEALSSLKTGKLSILTPKSSMTSADDHSLLHSQFESNADAHPKRPALEFWHNFDGMRGSVQRWDYATLNVSANRLARKLESRFGNLRGHAIPVMMEKQPELYLAVLAILKAGAGWSSIDISSPAKRRRDMISRIGSKLILVSQEATVEKAVIPDDVEVVHVSLQSRQNGNHEMDCSGKHLLPSPDSLAYLIWTSGTTGPAKAIDISHRAICSSMQSLQANIPYKTRSGKPVRCIQFAQHTFDVFVQDLFCTWNEGGTVISAAKQMMTGSFSMLCCESGATHAHLTPAFAATVKRDSCPGLEVITMIGEKLPQFVADDWGRNMKAFNTYGPAEVSVVATVNEFGAERKHIKSSNIGRPLPSVSCQVIRNGSIVMLQGVGELALGGPQIAGGYFKDVEKTDAKFIRRDGDQTKLYLTGDIVRQLADGTLEFIGREDDLVKLGGIRVELSEVSHAMMGCHELIHQIETFHLSRPDRPHKALVSFIAAKVTHDAQMTVSEWQLRPLCTAQAAEVARLALFTARQTLPGFMVPSNVLILPFIPKTSSAKVDRDALKTLYELFDLKSWESMMCDENLEEFDISSDIACNVRLCLSQFSGAPLETINIKSSFSSLGIDSISVSRFVQRLKKSDVDLSVTDILKCDTLAHALQLLQKRKSDSSAPMKQKAHLTAFSEAWLPHVRLYLNCDVSFVMPSSPFQEGVLSESMMETTSYWSNHFFKLAPAVNIEKLKSSWRYVSMATEALRTSFITTTALVNVGKLPPCPSPFLMLILGNSLLDWDELDARRGLKNIAKERADLVTARHQKSFFKQPPWAVTILDAGESKYMMFTVHHSLHDDESTKILINNIAAVYHGHELPDQHQITDALSSFLQYIRREKSESYWRSTLEKFTDIPVASWPNLAGRAEPLQLKDSRAMLTAKLNLGIDWLDLNQKARVLHTSCSVLLKVAFGCLLLDYLESSMIVFGEVVSQRFTNPEFRDAVAPLIAIKPIPFVIRSTIIDIISEQTNLNAHSRAYESLSGPLMRKIIRRPTTQPLYSAMFAFHPPTDTVEAEKAQSELWHQSEGFLDLFVEHDIALNVNVQNEVTIEVVAKGRLMNQDALEMLCRQIKLLTHAILVNPARAPTEILDDADPDILSISEAKLDEVEDDLSYTKSTYWLEFYAARKPDWIAVEVASGVSRGKFETEKWTFRKLYKESCRIASFLRKQGFKSSIIAVCVDRTLQSYAIITGIFMSGNTYLPIDNTLPQQRKMLLLEDSNCSVLISDKACVQAFDILPSICLTFNIDELNYNEQFRQTSDDPCPAPNPDDSAYLIYTSGSTGLPKGVLVSHRALCGFIGGLTGFMSQNSTLARSQAGVGKWLGLASRAFDVHLAEMFLAWRSGLTAVTASREILLDDLRFALTDLRVTHACFVPSLLEQAELEPDHIPEFVFMTIGGEKLSNSIIDTWAGHSRITAVNAYGPTELAIGCTAAHITRSLSASNIGFPYGNTVAHILVPGTLHYTKKGQAGELCFTGCLVGNGYHNRPEAQGFVEDFHGKRMYRTGDMARMHVDGSITYLGRSDDQTKLRGQRMELSEISGAIRTSSATPLEVATLIVDHPGLSSTFLTSFISNIVDRAKRYDAQPNLAIEDLREAAIRGKKCCQETLPGFMVPDHIIPVDVIPLAKTSGKANTRSLKAFFASLSVSKLLGIMEEGSKRSTKQKRKPGRLENQIAAVVHKTLRLSREYELDPHENLYALGLDSLNAVGLVLRFREIGFECTLSQLLEGPTIESITALRKWNSPSSPHMKQLATMKNYNLPVQQIFDQNESHILKTDVEKILPCLPMQESTVTATLTSQSSNSYINHVILKLDHAVDLGRFRQSWFDLIGERPILRTIFVNCNENFVQLVLRPEANKISWKTIEFDMAETASGMVSEVMKTTDGEILNKLQERPPLRLNLVTAKGALPLFVISIHHALYDAQSFEMMMEDIWTSYCGQPLPYRSTVDTLLDYRADQNPEVQKMIWQDYLKDFHQTRISKSRTNVEDSPGCLNEVFQLDLSTVRDLADRLEVTIAILMQYLFAIALARHLRRSDVLFGVILSGRSIPLEDAGLIAAPCISTVPQRLRILSNESLLDSLRHMRGSAAKCFEHQHASLRDIAKWVQLPLPMFDALFSFIYEDENELRAPHWTQIGNSMYLDYPLAVEILANKKSNSLSLKCSYLATFGVKVQAYNIIEDMKILLTMIYNGEDPKVQSLVISEQDTGLRDDAERWDEGHWSEIECRIKEAVQIFKSIESKVITKNITFFQLGIDSVSAIRLAKLLRKSNLMASSTDVMRYPSVGALGHFLSGKFQNASETVVTHMDDHPHLWNFFMELKPAATKSIEALYECTPLQAGMINSTLASGGSAYVNRHARLLPTNIDVERLREAWRIILRSLDILRTFFIFFSARQTWIACVEKKPSAATLALIERSHLHRNLAPITFSVEEDFGKPPWDADLISDGSQTAFVLTLHHALYDGNSLPVMFETLSRAYDGLELDLSHSPPFYEIAHSISSRASSAGSFWRENLRDYHTVGLHQPDRLPVQTFASRECRISPEEALKQCKVLGVTLQSVLLTTYAKVLAIKLQTRDVVFGHVVAGRSLSGIECENVIGPLFNTVPLRIYFDNLFLSNRDAIKRVLSFTTEGQEYQHASLAQTQTEWRKQNMYGTTRLFDSIFSLQKVSPVPENNFWRPLEVGQESTWSEYCLNFELEQTTSKLTINASCHEGCLVKTSLDELLQVYEEVLQNILYYPAEKVGCYPLGLSSLPSKKVDLNLERPVTTDFEVDTEMIHRVKAVLSRLSGVPMSTIANSYSIFSLGLTSLSAITVAAECRKIGLDLNVADILQGITITGIVDQLVNRIEQNQIRGKRASHITFRDLLQPPVKETSIEKILPALSGQTYHLVSWLGSGRTMYMPTWTYVCVKLEIQHFQKAWNILRERHPILRSTFAALNRTKAAQVVLKQSSIADPSFTYDCGPIDLRSIKDYVKAEQMQPKDMKTPPVRMRVIQGPSHDVVLLTLHHALYDAWSLPTILNDLTKLYHGSALEHSPSWVQFVEQYDSLHQSSEESIFWKGALNPYSRTVFGQSNKTIDRSPRAHLQRKFVSFPSFLTDVSRLSNLCYKYSVTFPTVLIVSYARSLATVTNVRNPVFGLFSHGRSFPFPKMLSLAGPCLNMLPLAVCSPWEEPWYSKAQEVQKALGARIPYEQSSLPEVMQYAQEDHAEPLEFNTFVNILWSENAQAKVAEDDKDCRFFKPIDVGVPSDFAPQQRFAGDAALEELRWPVSNDGIYIDLALNQEHESINIGVRIEGESIDQDKVKTLMLEFERAAKKMLELV